MLRVSILDHHRSPIPAEVYLDGKLIGSSFLNKEGLLPGAHRLEIRMDGFRRLKQRILLKPGRLTRVVKELTPLKASPKASAVSSP